MPAPPRPTGTIIMAEGAALYRLMAWLSPSYPVGAFSYSHGIEQLVEDGSIAGRDALAEWLEDILRFGSGRNDAILFAAAHRAATARDKAALQDVSELALAFAPSAERQLETSAQGRAFAEITRTVWHNPTASAGQIAYPVAVAVACADHGIPLRAALEAYLHAFAANLVSAGVRLVPLGHTDGQRVLMRLEHSVAEAAEAALSATLDDLGACTFMADIAAMKHETQHTRLFRS